MSGMSKLEKKYQIKATEEKNRTDTAVCVRACVCVIQGGSLEFSTELYQKGWHRIYQFTERTGYDFTYFHAGNIDALLSQHIDM